MVMSVACLYVNIIKILEFQYLDEGKQINKLIAFFLDDWLVCGRINALPNDLQCN